MPNLKIATGGASHEKTFQVKEVSGLPFLLASASLAGLDEEQFSSACFALDLGKGQLVTKTKAN